MSETNPFGISLDVGKLKRRRKDTSDKSVARSDEAADRHGFVPREAASDPKRKRGRPPSPRKGQVHAKVLPHIAKEISREAKERGVQQGVLIEEAWALYKAVREEES